MQSIGRSSSWGRGAGLEEWWCKEREKMYRGGGEWWISTDVVEIKINSMQVIQVEHCR
jgi:hypothetical protein